MKGVQHSSVGVGRDPVSMLTAKGIEEGMSKDDDKSHLFKEINRYFITVCALDASVMRKGGNCLLKCCASHNQH